MTRITANHTIAASFSAINAARIIGYAGAGTVIDSISDANGCYINATRFLATANLNVTTMKVTVQVPLARQWARGVSLRHVGGGTHNYRC